MPKPRTARKSQSNSAPAVIKAFESSTGSGPDLEERIRQRAYDLFLERGGKHGYAEEDWLRAEAEILGENHRRTA